MTISTNTPTIECSISTSSLVNLFYRYISTSKNYFTFTFFLIVNLNIVFAQTNDLENIKSLKKTDTNKAIELTESLWPQKNHKQHIDIGLELITLYRKTNSYKKIINISDELLSNLNITHQQKGLVLEKRLITMRLMKSWDDIDNIEKESLKVMPFISDTRLLAGLNHSIGLIKHKQFELTPAIKYFKAALEHKGEELSENVAGLYLNIGVMYAQKGDYPEATSAMLKSVRIYDSIGQDAPINLLQNLGALSIYLEEWDKAIKYLKLAIKTQDIKKPKNASLYSNLGVAYIGIKENDIAYEYFEESLNVSKQQNKTNASALNNMAYLLKEKGDYNKALKMFLMVESIYIETKSNGNIGIAKKNLGDIWVKLNNNNKAAKYFEESYKIYKNKEFFPKLIELFPVMINNLDAQGKQTEALKYMREFKELNDKLVNTDSKERIATLQSSFDLEKKQKELLVSEQLLSRLEHDKVIKSKAFDELIVARKEQTYIQWILILIVSALTIFGLLLLRINRFRKESNQILEDKNKQIQSQHIELLTLNKELKKQSLQDKITGLKSRRYFIHFLENKFTQLDKPNQTQLIIMLDINYFTVANDKYGNNIGDEVLINFANIIKSCSRKTDFLVRWDGEEFLWFCTATTIEQGINLCEKFIETFSSSNIISKEETIKPNCSIGLTNFPIWGDSKVDWDDSVKIAHAALIQAKKVYGNNWIGYTALSKPDYSKLIDLNVEKLFSDGYLQKLTKD